MPSNVGLTKKITMPKCVASVWLSRQGASLDSCNILAGVLQGIARSQRCFFDDQFLKLKNSAPSLTDECTEAAQNVEPRYLISAPANTFVPNDVFAWYIVPLIEVAQQLDVSSSFPSCPGPSRTSQMSAVTLSFA
jgi:hypothetical protein